MTKPISENLWWLLPNKLGGVRKPTEEELSQLQAVGVGAIVSVFHDSSNLDLYKQVGIPHLWLPIQIDGAPSQEQMQEFRNFVNSQNLLGHAVAVHCSTGIHRTGTMLASYLIGSGVSYEGAMNAILSANSDVKLPEAQVSFLQKLAETQVN